MTQSIAMFQYVDFYIVEHLNIIRTSYLTIFFKLITLLGDKIFFIAVLPALWQIMEKKFTINFTITILLSVVLNVILKDCFERLRPFLIYPNLNLVAANGYSFPSGHAQIAILFWGILANKIKHKWFSIITIILILLIGISRVYLGVHYASDVIIGWLIGGVILFAHMMVLSDLRLNLITFIISIISIILVMSLGLNKDLVALFAALCGFTAGYHLLAISINQPKKLSIKINIIFSIITTLLIYLIAKVIFHPLTLYSEYLYQFILYLILGLWVSLGIDYSLTYINGLIDKINNRLSN